MDKKAHTILGIHVQDRIHQVPDLQNLFTQFGCNIRTRLGLHEVDKNSCSTTGLIILEVTGEALQIDQLIDALNQADGVEVQKMVFEHD